MTIKSSIGARLALAINLLRGSTPIPAHQTGQFDEALKDIRDSHDSDLEALVDARVDARLAAHGLIAQKDEPEADELEDPEKVEADPQGGDITTDQGAEGASDAGGTLNRENTDEALLKGEPA